MIICFIDGNIDFYRNVLSQAFLNGNIIENIDDRQSHKTNILLINYMSFIDLPDGDLYLLTRIKDISQDAKILFFKSTYLLSHFITNAQPNRSYVYTTHLVQYIRKYIQTVSNFLKVLTDANITPVIIDDFAYKLCSRNVLYFKMHTKSSSMIDIQPIIVSCENNDEILTMLSKTSYSSYLN